MSMSMSMSASVGRRVYRTLIASKGTFIMAVIVIEFVTLDGRVSDPDGRGGSPTGGWAFRHGPETVGGDKFRLGRTLDEGLMLLGRRTWPLPRRTHHPHRTGANRTSADRLIHP